MVVKKFVGYSHNAVLERIKKEIGKDAVILYSSYKKAPGLLRFFIKSRYEIIAGRDVSSCQQTRNQEVKPKSSDLTDIQFKLDELTKYMKSSKSNTNNRYYNSFKQYFSSDIAGLYAEKFDLEDEKESFSKVFDHVTSRIRCSDGIEFANGEPTRVALVGPTGVGKTTTIAKLMSVYTYKGKKVSVLSNDNYRIAAYEQLKRICDLVGTEMRKVVRPEDIQTELSSLKTSDLILMDTAGRSQQSSSKLTELLKILEAFNPHEIHLVVSATTESSTIYNVIENFKGCRFTKVILTKMDETVKPGNLMDIFESSEVDLSFITKGQKIPQDIEIADSERVASLMLKREVVHV